MKKIFFMMFIYIVAFFSCNTKNTDEKETIEQTSENVKYLAKVKFGGKWGFIDTTGKYVINPQFDWADDFSSIRK